MGVPAVTFIALIRHTSTATVKGKPFQSSDIFSLSLSVQSRWISPVAADQGKESDARNGLENIAKIVSTCQTPK